MSYELRVIVSDPKSQSDFNFNEVNLILIIKSGDLLKWDCGCFFNIKNNHL